MLGALILLTAALIGADDRAETTSDLAGRVRQLVRQLDSPQLGQRDAAEEELVRLGTKVLDFLPRSVDPARAEVAQRVGRIRQRLQRARAESAVEPSRLTLRGAMPLDKVFAALEEQTGNKIDASRLSGPILKQEVAVDCQKTPFWEALDRLLDQTKLAFYPYGEKRSVELVPQSGPRQPRPGGRLCYAGPFRFEAVAVLAQRDLRAPENRSLRLEIEVAWEPRLAPINFRQRLADVKAVDERGDPLATESREAALEIPVERGPIAKRFALPLALPPRDVRTIASLRGTLQALVPSQMETFRFDHLPAAKHVAQRAAGVAVVLEGASQSDKSVELRLLVRFDQPGEALASHRTWIFNNPARLQRPGGKPIAPESAMPTRQTTNELGIAYEFRVDGPLGDYTFVYQTPGMILSTPLEYEFRDIPLP
jgi:hypothetical protein